MKKAQKLNGLPSMTCGVFGWEIDIYTMIAIASLPLVPVLDKQKTSRYCQ